MLSKITAIWTDLSLDGDPTCITVEWVRPDGAHRRHHEILPPGATIEEADACIALVLRCMDGPFE